MVCKKTKYLALTDHPMCMLCEYGCALVILVAAYFLQLCVGANSVYSSQKYDEVLVEDYQTLPYLSFDRLIIKIMNVVKWKYVRCILQLFSSILIVSITKKIQKIVQNKDAARLPILHRRNFNPFYICLPCKLLFQLCWPW